MYIYGVCILCIQTQRPLLGHLHSHGSILQPPHTVLGFPPGPALTWMVSWVKADLKSMLIFWTLSKKPERLWREGTEGGVREPHPGWGSLGKTGGQSELGGGISCLLLPAGATHLALDFRGCGPGGEGDLCRGQDSSSLGVRVSVLVVGGVWGQFRTGTFAGDGVHLLILESGFGHPALAAVTHV